MSLKRASIALLLLSCGGTQAATPPPPDITPRVVLSGTDLYLVHAPAALIRDHLFYVLGPEVIPGSSDHPKIGIMRGVDRSGDSLKVAWFTLPDERVGPALADSGLPIKLIDQDLEPRIDRHWGNYVPQLHTPFPGPKGPIVLELNLGDVSGVKAGDQYDVLGDAKTNNLNRTVDAFERLGTCTVLPFGTDQTRSSCQLDRGESALLFSEPRWRSGGYVKAITKR
ncbi:MAG: hypothetical protein ABI193_17755 [Minicystis sp.]